MTTRIPKIGDRYQFGYNPGTVYEVVLVNTYCVNLINIVNGDYLKNILFSTLRDPYYFTYLGNFAKDSNFNELYDLFNSI